jgi:hypothetical protein
MRRTAYTLLNSMRNEETQRELQSPQITEFIKQYRGNC